jgi:beta-glucosidase
MTDPHAFDLGGLKLGVATCALQIEGGDTGNNWYDWAKIPGRIKDGSTPLRATDHWSRWREDTELMASLGLQIYRLGVEWSRIEPSPGEFDHAVLDRYREELQLLRDRGIAPLVTLHHFTNPRWFEELGAWTNTHAVETFTRFVGVVTHALGDLVSDWCTINEPNVYALGGYLDGQFPPGRKNGWTDVRKVLRNMARAHCAAYTLIHERQPDARVGFAHHLRVFDPLNPRNPVHRTLSKVNAHLFQDALSDAFLGGRFSRVLGGQPDDVTPGTYYDYLGINYYSRTAVSKIDDGTFPFAPVNDLGWEIYPEGIVAVAEDLHRRYPGPIWITENGTCDNTDSFRARYLYDHLGAITASGLPFERYYHWCFVDNWEWAEGEVPRFGIVALDYETQERTVKDSGRFYAGIIAAGGVTEELYAAHVAPQTYHRAGADPKPRG